MNINLGNVFNAGNIVLWPDYDADGDGYLSPSEYDAYISAGGFDIDTIPRITQEDLDAIEAGAGSGTSVSPYEDGSASDAFRNSSWPNSETEVEAALIAAAETGNIDVIEAILSTASNAVSGAVLNTVMETFYDSFGIPAGLDDLSGYGSTPRPEFNVDLDSLAAIYLAAGSNNEIPLTEMDAQGLALGEHMRAVKENIQQANAYVDAYGGSFYDYFVMPNLLVELSPLAQEYDANRNGSLDENEMVEYTEAWEKENGIMRFADGTSATAATAKAADLDGDGKVSPQELEFWELNRGGDTDPNPSRTAFLEDYGFDASPSAAWVDKFARQSAESFQTGAQQILTQGLQDAAIAILGIHQNGLLEQLESGADTLSRPIIDKDAPAYSIIGADIDSYFNRIFGGKDTISRDALLTNDEFYAVGIQLATRNSSTPALSEAGITLTDTDQALVDRYVAVRDDYQAGVNFTFAGDPSAVTIDDIAAEKTRLLAAAQSPLAKASISKLTDDQIRDRITTERKNAAIMAGVNENGIYSPEFLQKRDELVAAGITNAAAVLANVDPFSELRPLLYEKAITQIGDAADALVAKRDAAGGYSDLDPKTKNMLNLASFGVRAVGSMAETFAGALALVKETSSDSVLGRFGSALINLSSSIETQDFKDAADEVEARLGRATGFWGTAEAIFEDGVPLEYILRNLLPEVGEEVLLSKITGGTTKGVKFNGANSEFKEFLTNPASRPDGAPTWLKDKLSTLIGKDEYGDIAELIAGTAGGTFDRAYDVAIATGDYTDEEAKEYAYGVMSRATMGAFVVNRLAAGIGIDDLIENFFPGDNNKAIRKVLTSIQNHPAIKTFLSAGGEGLSEGGEEAIVALISTSELALLDPTIDVAGEVGQGAFLGLALGSLVDVTMTGGFAIDNAASNVAAAFNPDINKVLTTARTDLDAGANLADVTANMEASFNGMGLANVPLQTDILNGVDDASYTTGLETEEKFKELGYTPTEEEIDEYIGKSNEADTLNNIDTYVDPRQVTIDEAKAELIAQGITDPSDAEVAAYVGQGDETFQSTKNTEIETYADPRVIDEAEARAALQAQGIANPTTAEVAQFTGQGDENFETNNIGKATDYANPLALSAAEIEAIAAKQGYTLAAGEAETLSGRVIPGQTEAEALASQENTFNNAAITKAELEAAAAAQGYALTPEDLALIGNNPNAAQELLDADNRFNAGAITREEIETAARNAGIDPKDLIESDYALVGNIAEKDADGNFIPAEDILAGEQARFEGRVADAATAAQRTAAETAITAAVTAAGAPALSPTDLERYVGMVIGGGLTIAEAVQAAETDIAAAAAADADADADADAGTTYTAGTYVDPDGDGVYQLVGEDGETLTGEFNADGTAVTGDTDTGGTDTGGTDTGGTDTGGNQSVMDQVLAAIAAAGVDLAQDKIDEIVADVVSGAVTDIDKAVADTVTEYQLGNDTDPDADTPLEDITIEGDTNDYVRVGDFNAGVTALQNNVIALINQLEAAGATRDEALAAAVGVPAGQPGGPSGIYAELDGFATSDQAKAIQKVVDGIAAELGTTAADVAAIKVKLDTLVTKDDISGLATKDDISGLATKDDISGLATKEDVTNAEGRLEARINELMTRDGKNRLDAVDIALEELATELGTTKNEITKQLTKFESDLALDIAKLATKQDVLDSESRIRSKQDEYVRLGMKADEALQAAINDVATELGITKDVLTDQLAAFQTKLDADLSLLATKQQVSTLETELYLKLAEYEAQGKTRDEATQLAIKDLAANLETTEDNLMTQLGVTQDTLTDRINTVETNLTNQFNSQIESTKELITETATDTQKQIKTAANQSAARDFFDMVLGSEDLEGQQVTVSQSPLAQINYIYDWQDPLANQQQRGFFGAASPYGESLAAGKSRRPQTIANVMQGPLNLQGAPVGPMGMAAGGKVDYDFLKEISQIMSFGE